MIDKSDRQTFIYESCDEKTKRSIEEFIKMVREEIREWRFWSWHEQTKSCLDYTKSVVNCVERDLLGKCSTTDKNCKKYMSKGITMIDFTLRIRDEIKKHNFPENIRRRIEIIEPCLKMFEENMEYNLGLRILEGYPTADDFFYAEYRILKEEEEDVKYDNWEPLHGMI